MSGWNTLDQPRVARGCQPDYLHTNLQSLSDSLHSCLQEERKGTITNELATVLSSISLACKQIASLVTRAGISNLTGLGGMSNSSVSTSAFLFLINSFRVIMQICQVRLEEGM